MSIREKLFNSNRNKVYKNLRSVPLLKFLKAPYIVDPKGKSYGGVYLIFNTENGLPYVGETNNLVRRLLEHSQWALDNGKKPRQSIGWAIRKDSGKHFRIAILAIENHKQTRLELETKYVELFNAYYNGYNGTKNGEPDSPFVYTFKKRFKKFRNQTGKKKKNKFIQKYIKKPYDNMYERNKYNGWFSLWRYQRHLKKNN